MFRGRVAFLAQDVLIDVRAFLGKVSVYAWCSHASLYDHFDIKFP